MRPLSFPGGLAPVSRVSIRKGSIPQYHRNRRRAPHPQVAERPL